MKRGRFQSLHLQSISNNQNFQGPKKWFSCERVSESYVEVKIFSE